MKDKACWAYLKQTVVKDENSQSNTSQNHESEPSPLTIKRQLFQLSKTVVYIGRVQGDIKLNLPVISSKHCTLMFNPATNKVVLKDTSTNGTFVNGILVGKNKTCEVNYNDKIRFGKNSKAKNTKKISQKPVKVPTFVLLKVPATTKEKGGPDDEDSKHDLGLSPIAKSSSQLSPNCENFDDFEVSFIGDRKRENENTGDVNSYSKRRKLSNDFECPQHDTSNGTDKITSVSGNNISADISTAGSVGTSITSIRESNRKLQKSNEELREQLQSCNTKIGSLQTAIVDLKSQLSSAQEIVQQSKTSAEANEFSDEIQKAKSLNEKLESENSELKQQKGELAAEVLRLEQKLDNAIKSKSETNSTFKLANQDNLKLKEELDHLKVEVAKLQETKANLSVIVERKEKDATTMKADIMNLENKLEESREKRGSLESKNEELAAKTESLEERLLQQSVELNDAQSKLKEATSSLDTLKTSKETIEKKLVEVEERGNELQVEIEGLKSKEKIEQTEKDNLLASNRRYQEANDSLRKDLEAIREENDTVVIKLREMTSKYDANEKQLGEMEQKTKESMNELQQQLSSLREKHDALATSNKELRTQNEAFEKDVIDLQNKHQNTLGQWNSAKEQLDVERSRIVDAFQSLKTATSFFEKGINAVHAARLVTEPSQVNSLSSNDESKNDQGAYFGVEEATQQDAEAQSNNIMHSSKSPQPQNVPATQQAVDDEDEENECREDVNMTTIAEGVEFLSPAASANIDHVSPDDRAVGDGDQMMDGDNVMVHLDETTANFDNNEEGFESAEQSSIAINIGPIE